MNRYARIQDDGLTVKFKRRSKVARVSVSWIPVIAVKYPSKNEAKAAKVWWEHMGIVMGVQ